MEHEVEGTLDSSVNFSQVKGVNPLWKVVKIVMLSFSSPATFSSNMLKRQRWVTEWSLSNSFISSPTQLLFSRFCCPLLYCFYFLHLKQCYSLFTFFWTSVYMSLFLFYLVIFFELWIFNLILSLHTLLSKCLSQMYWRTEKKESWIFSVRFSYLLLLVT